MANARVPEGLKFETLTFVSIFLSYMLYTYNRKSVSHVLPVLMRDGLPKNVAGSITSSQNMAYAISRFFSGILSDRIDSRTMLALGLVLTGITTLAFPCFDSQIMYVLLWFFNGFAQGFGWPACAKILKEKFSSDLFGKLWGILSCSANISGAVGTVVSTQIILAYSWRTCLVFAGAISILMSVVIFFSLGKDSKQITAVAKQSESKKSDQRKHKLWHSSLNIPLLAFVAFCYFSVFCAKTCCLDWTSVYLTEELGHTPTTASVFVGSLEMGGLVGGILAGVLSDLLIKLHTQVSSNNRLMLSFFYMVILCCGFHVLCFNISTESSGMFLSLLGFTLGMCLFGPITLFGIVATESAPSHLSGTAHAVVSLFANAGGVIAGYPFASLAKNYNWWTVFFTVYVSCLITIVVMIYNCRFWLLSTKKLKTL